MPFAQTLFPVALPPVGAAVLGAVRARRAMRSLYPEPQPVVDVTEGIAPAHDSSLPTAVLLCDHAGTEVFAHLPLERPDLVVIPHLVAPNDALLAWVREQAEAGTVVLTICTGAGVAARAGLLDRRRAATHWGDLAAFERRHPNVEWVKGMRYVDDGDICSSAGITSGIDATLHVIRRLAGDDALDRAAEAIGYTDRRYLADPTTDQHRIAPADLIFPLTAAFGRRPHLDVLLRDGIDETSLAAAMDVHAATCTARLTTISSDGQPVRSRHGLALVPRAARRGDAPSPSLAPAISQTAPTSATADGRSVLCTRETPFHAFRVALDDLARRHGRPIARFAAERLEYRSSSPAPASDGNHGRHPANSDLV